MRIVCCFRHTYRRRSCLAPSVDRQWLSPDPAYPWVTRWLSPPVEPLGDEAAELTATIARALDSSEPGDLLYLAETACTHADGMVRAIVEGLTHTDADYVSLSDCVDDYWPVAATDCPSGAAGGGDPVALSGNFIWRAQDGLVRSFGCRRGVLERDRHTILSYADYQSGDVGWTMLWQGLRRRGRALRTVLPALAVSTVPTEYAPSFRGTRSTVCVGELEEWDFWRRPDQPQRIGVMPEVSSFFCAELAQVCPGSRLVALPAMEAILSERHSCVAVTLGEKEEVDDFLRFRRHAVTAMLVELSDTDPGRTVRWVSGRDWLLPAAAHLVSPWIV